MNKKFVMIATVSTICLATVVASFSASAMQVPSNQVLQEAKNHNYITMQGKVPVRKSEQA